MSQQHEPSVLLPELADVLGHLFWRGNARAVAVLTAHLPPPLDAHGHAVLTTLVDEGAPLSQQAVADRLLLSRTTLTTVAAQLLAHGLVERVRNPEDRRAYLMTPTPAGRRTLAAGHRRLGAADAELGEPLGPNGASELLALLPRLLRPHLAEAGAQPPDRLLASLAFLLTRTHALHHRVVAEAVAPLDLEPRDLGALTALDALGPVPQTELARALGVSGAHLVQIADDLERVGAVERRRAPEDRRTQLLHPLPASARLLTAAHAAARGASEPWSAALPARSRQRLRRLLVQLVTG
ncbi:MarR family winged helix-turn-helix transcriptional regulator [Nocardioides nanhaiensis]|uniref:HTH marR-type domain-containing protein n=1 Tax=Nocardioides nanhaiensis TaxID=1476871 RepID=A0ABP8WFM8_9ACTN